MFRCIAPLVFSGVLLLTGFGCSPQAPQTPPEDAPAQSVMVRMEPEKALDIGDVEADARLEVTLDEAMRDTDITVEEMRTAMGELNLTRIDLPWPPPEQLLLHCEMKYSNNYTNTPVSADIRLLRDDVIVANEGGILAGRSFENPLAFVVDVFEGLQEFPETMLVHAELTLAFFPDENAAVINTETTTKLSNPVRINFAPRPADAPEDEATESSEDDAEGAGPDDHSPTEEAAP